MDLMDRLPDTSQLKVYGFQPLGNPLRNRFDEVIALFDEHLVANLRNFGAKNLEGFTCKDYHNYLEKNNIDHHHFIHEYRRNCPSSWLKLDYFQALFSEVERFVGTPVCAHNDTLEFRVVRPGKDDSNSWHRDHWFPYFKPLINVYLPLSGSFANSAMQIVPFSHLWTDQEVVPTFGFNEGKSEKNGLLYSVPEIKYCKHDIVGYRPVVPRGDFVLFDPKCVHGEGTNLGQLETRFSFEFRLEAI